MKSGSALVQIADFEGEPLARLAESRLREVGIASVVRPLGPGPGGWGQAAALPYGLWVQPEDEGIAREVLALPPPAVGGAPRRLTTTSRVAFLVVLLALLALGASFADRVLELLFR